MVINIVGGACSINYYDGQGIYIYNSDYTYDADAGIGTYQGGSFEVYGEEDLYLRKGSYTYSLPNKDGTIALADDIKHLYHIHFDTGKNSIKFGSYSAVICLDIYAEDGADIEALEWHGGNFNMVSVSPESFGTIIRQMLNKVFPVMWSYTNGFDFVYNCTGKNIGGEDVSVVGIGKRDSLYGLFYKKNTHAYINFLASSGPFSASDSTTSNKGYAYYTKIF